MTAIIECVIYNYDSVILAEFIPKGAGIQFLSLWIPVFTGMTNCTAVLTEHSDRI